MVAPFLDLCEPNNLRLLANINVLRPESSNKFGKPGACGSVAKHPSSYNSDGRRSKAMVTNGDKNRSSTLSNAQALKVYGPGSGKVKLPKTGFLILLQRFTKGLPDEEGPNKE